MRSPILPTEKAASLVTGLDAGNGCHAWPAHIARSCVSLDVAYSHLCLGAGGAISLPAWQATIQDIVPKPWVASAVALNSISFNVARAVGPALGGVVVAALGAAFAFFANAISFLVVLLAVAFWKRSPLDASPLSEDLVGAIRAGFRYLLHAPAYRLPIVRAIAFNLCAAAVWPLLPLFARDVLGTSATGYGLLLGAFGLGSIFSAFALPRLRTRFALDGILGVGAVVAAMAFFSQA